jgi:AbrB family looped-hinge helix DNA binding protein
MTKAIISSKGQIVIPKAVRERLNLKAGTEVLIDVQGEALVMKRFVPDHPDWHTMRGMFRGANLLEDLTDDRAAEIARDHARVQSR